MPRVLPFRLGRLDYSGGPAFNSRDITIQDAEVQLALGDAINMILPPSYSAHPAAVQTVEMTSIVLDFGQRLVDYDTIRLRNIIALLKSGTPLPPLSVTAQAGGTYKLENGYHRFLACALIGFKYIPVDQAALAVAPPVLAPAPSAGKWVSKRVQEAKRSGAANQ